jgi:putative transposase
MPYDQDKDHRRSIRLHGHDYVQGGVYFVTICTYARSCWFDDASVRRIAHHEWEQLPRRFTMLTLDTSIIMPNHLHGILTIHPPGATNNGTKTPQAPSNLQPGSLGAIVRSYKSTVTRRVRNHTSFDAPSVWQRGYWERIVRDDEELAAIRQYIIDNPARWAERRDNLDALHARMTFARNG